jgi:hypothetical protein
VTYAGFIETTKNTADCCVFGDNYKVKSYYRVSILSNQAAKNFFITSKNNNKIAGITESVKSCNLHQKGSFKA